MKRLIAVTVLSAAATAGAQAINNLELGLTGGYAGGLSGEVFIHAPNVVGPVGVKVGVAYSKPTDPVNDSADLSGGAGLLTLNNLRGIYGANNVPESGSQTVISADATYGLGEVAPGVDTLVYGGVRYGMFNSTYSISGTDAYTTYSSNSLGLGAGAMASYALTGNLSLVGDLGADYFFKSTINKTGKDVSGGTLNDSFATSEPGYSYEDAAFNRPGTNFKARIGIKYMF